MPPKSEPNLLVKIPTSGPSIKSTVKDLIKTLQDLDKTLATNKELEAMQAKVKMLEEENTSLKAELESVKNENKNLEDEVASLQADFQAAERDFYKLVKLFYKQKHQNGKEVQGLKTEIKRLENKNQVLKDENASLKHAKVENTNDRVAQLFKESASAIKPAIPSDDSESVIDEIIANYDESLAREPNTKKPRLEVYSDAENPWKCNVMFCRLNRKCLCGKCPYSMAHTSAIS